MYRTFAILLAFVFTFTACQSDNISEEVCYAAAIDADFDDATLNEEGECVGMWESNIDDTARYTCNATGCAQACGSNICAAWRPNGTGGCNFACIVRSVIDEPVRF
ncbi:MAG: hypothetical protein AB8H79_03685 [Myxococcota bacterium]